MLEALNKLKRRKQVKEDFAVLMQYSNNYKRIESKESINFVINDSYKRLNNIISYYSKDIDINYLKELSLERNYQYYNEIIDSMNTISELLDSDKSIIEDPKYIKFKIDDDHANKVFDKIDNIFERYYNKSIIFLKNNFIKQGQSVNSKKQRNRHKQKTKEGVIFRNIFIRFFENEYKSRNIKPNNTEACKLVLKLVNYPLKISTIRTDILSKYRDFKRTYKHDYNKERDLKDLIYFSIRNVTEYDINSNLEIYHSYLSILSEAHQILKETTISSSKIYRILNNLNMLDENEDNDTIVNKYIQYIEKIQNQKYDNYLILLRDLSKINKNSDISAEIYRKIS